MASFTNGWASASFSSHVWDAVIITAVRERLLGAWAAAANVWCRRVRPRLYENSLVEEETWDGSKGGGEGEAGYEEETEAGGTAGAGARGGDGDG